MWGLDYLGGAKFADLIVHEHPEGWAAGFFTNTFGDALPTISRLLATGRCPRVRLHLLWKDDHNFTLGDLPALGKEAKRVAPLVNKFASVEFQISAACEHNLNFKDAEAFRQCVLQNMPKRIVYVNTPMRGATLNNCINEHHGNKFTGGQQFSCDGNSCVDSDIETLKTQYRNAITFFFWHSRFNGKWSDNDKTPRPARKGWPDSHLLNSVIALASSRGSTDLPKGWIFKSHAENSNGTDPKSDKPVWITPVKAREIILKSRNGHVLDIAKFYGAFIDKKRWRYYSPNWGYLIAQTAISIQNDPLCEVWVNDKKVGVINTAFRDGEYHE